MSKKAAGRNALAPAEPVGPEFLGKSDDTLSAPAYEKQQQLVTQFGDGLPWHPDHYENAIRNELRRGCEAFLKAGSYLIVARECALHGEWQGILDRLGIGRDQAARMMEASRRVSALPNAATSQHLLSAAKSQGKLIELLSLPEDQFTELATEGKTDELSLDDISTMTVRELRDAVREARADVDAKNQRISKLSEDLNKEHDKVTKAQRKWKGASADERQVMLENKVSEAEAAIRANITSDKSGLAAALNELAAHCTDNDLDCSAFVGDVFGRLLTALRVIRDREDYGFEVPIVSDMHGA
ncbi:hypothetical protein RDV84_00290 [Lysobacter yananisis]|uniref:DUF3102 domain-containing protein n=1 Tax=Lysobacter yananisis TaxID=1003114 RepID=A0ABY9P8V0_9GAMM|nr:hypothetical protein [Lysobacter yananisis]WMT03329.1 hypothetical protein RDV84_00290 [Lysobacter yananisis]